MTHGITAMGVHHNSGTLASLKNALERQGMSVLQADSRARAAQMPGGQNPVRSYSRIRNCRMGRGLTSWPRPRGPLNP